MDINILKENITIFIGIFVTIVTMGIATLYDKYHSEGKISFDFKTLKPSSNLNEKIKSFSIKDLNGFSELKKKLSSFTWKKPDKNKFEIPGMKSLNLKTSIQELIGNLKDKISSISLTLPGKGNNQNENESVLSSKKEKASISGEPDKVDDFDVDKIIESKKDELDFDDDLLTEMSTASSLNDDNIAVENVELENPFSEDMSSDDDASMNSDLMFDDSEFDVGFGEMDSETPEEDLSFDSDFDDIQFEDESDSLIASLKKDIVIRKEDKIDFMAEMRGENLDVKLLKTELEDVLGELNKYKQCASNNN